MVVKGRDKPAEKKMAVVVAAKSPVAIDIKAQVQMIQQIMRELMIDGTHFGTIPGTNKPTLYKAGSEMLLTAFHIAVDPQVEDQSNEDEIRYSVVARGIYRDGTFVGGGVGVCSTNEDKYKWRGIVNRTEFDETPDNRRRIKQTKSGPIYQVRTNPADLANTILKMAKKRAQIDMTLTATAASDIFAQDLEDVVVDKPVGGKPIVADPEELTPVGGTLPDFDQIIKTIMLEKHISAVSMREILSVKFQRKISKMSDLTLVEKEATVKLLQEGK